MLTYLAQPYTHADAFVRQARIAAARHITVDLMKSGFSVFSPIVHGTCIESLLPEASRTDHKFWMGQCLAILRHCQQMVVIPLTGWRESRGLAEELEFCRLAKIDVLFLSDWAHPPGDSPWLKFDFPSQVEFAANPSWGYGHV